MTDGSLPEPRSPDPHDPVRPRALALPAVAEPPLDERRPWLERYAFTDALAMPALETPVYLTDDGLALTTSGLGKSDAATTVATLCAAPGIDLESAYVVSAGVAGSSPGTAGLGSVFLADAVLDWDRKHRWDRGEDRDRDPDRGDEEPPIGVLAYEPEDTVHRLNPDLVDAALAAAERVDLRAEPAAREYQRRYPEATDEGPTIGVGTTVSGDEFWHGARYARQVEWLCAAYDVAPYATTQMEEAATATALERFDAVDRYVSVRAVANYDRPAPGQTVEESFEGVPESLAMAIENAARVGSAVVDDLRERDPLGLADDETPPTE